MHNNVKNKITQLAGQYRRLANRAGFLLPCGVEKPQECLVPFKVLPRRMAAKRQAIN